MWDGNPLGTYSVNLTLGVAHDLLAGIQAKVL